MNLNDLFLFLGNDNLVLQYTNNPITCIKRNKNWKTISMPCKIHHVLIWIWII